MLGESESYVYLPYLQAAYIEGKPSGNYVSAASNNGRIAFFGTESQAGQYKTAGLGLPVVKLPRNTDSITISFSNVQRLYNNTNVFIFWTKDISGPYYPNCAYYVSSEEYNARQNNSELKDNTLSVPDDVDSFVGYFRIYPVLSENETPESVANDVGFSITFNKR